MINYSSVARTHLASCQARLPYQTLHKLGEALDVPLNRYTGQEHCLMMPVVRDKVRRLLEFMEAMEDILLERCIVDMGSYEDPSYPNFYKHHLLGNRGAMRALIPHVPIARKNPVRDRVAELFGKIDTHTMRHDLPGFIQTLQGNLGIQPVFHGGSVSLPQKITLYNMRHGGMHFVYPSDLSEINMSSHCDCCEGPATGIFAVRQFAAPLV